MSDLAERSGLSERTIEHLESGDRQRYRDSTLGRVEEALGWRPGTIRRIVDGNGGDNGELESDQLLDRVITRWPYLTPDERRALVDLLETFTRRR